MSRFVLVLLLTFSRIAVLAQQEEQHAERKMEINGRILDSATRRPVEYASISLFVEHSNKPSGGTLTGNKGNFTLAGLEPGVYMLTIGRIGYTEKTLGPFSVDRGHVLVNIGDILLGNKATEMQAVTVTAPSNLVENKLDKMVYNAEKDVTSLGGVATDVLKKVPMVSVDIDGNVQLMGNSNILFLINGQPSSIFGNNLADALQTIPASQIKSIEVITSPGAKYDAEGTGGIINIILKDNKLNGINGNISATGGTRLQNGSLNLNARHGHFGANVFFSGNAQLPSTTNNHALRQAFDSAGDPTSLLTQDGSSRFIRKGFETGLGLQWDIDKRNTLNGNLGYDNFGNRNNGSIQQDENDLAVGGNPANDLRSLVQSNSHFRAHSVDWSLLYKRTFAQEDREVDISMDGSQGNNHSDYGQVQSLPSGDSAYTGSRGTNAGADRETNFRIDYVQPIGDRLKWEAGGRIQIRRITSNSPVYSLDPNADQYVYDSSQSNALTYGRHVYAGYAALTFPIAHALDVKAGLRYERTGTDAAFSKAPDTRIPGYNTFAPSLVLSHSFSQDEQLKLSYSHRIHRPDYRSLNPYVNASDPKNLSRGNPFLQPEIANNFELGYSKSFGDGNSLNVALFYRRSDQDIQPFIVYYDQFVLGDTTYDQVSVNTPMNVGSENNYGLNIYGSVSAGKKLKLRSNLSFFDRYITTGTLGGNAVTSFNYRMNLNATYQAAPTFVLEFFGNFNSSRNEIQGRYPSFTSYTLAARKQFWNKKASIAFTATNPFRNVVDQAIQVSGAGFALNSLRQVPYRSFGINLTWKFGHLEFKKDKDKDEEKDTPAPSDPN